jgi:hypothetical protein
VGKASLSAASLGDNLNEKTANRYQHMVNREVSCYCNDRGTPGLARRSQARAKNWVDIRVWTQSNDLSELVMGECKQGVEMKYQSI